MPTDLASRPRDAEVWRRPTRRRRAAWVALHPRLAQQIEQQFLVGEFELAVFAAMREVEVRVRGLAKGSQSLLGVKLAPVMFTFELAERRPDPVVNALYPATLMDTKVSEALVRRA